VCVHLQKCRSTEFLESAIPRTDVDIIIPSDLLSRILLLVTAKIHQKTVINLDVVTRYNRIVTYATIGYHFIIHICNMSTG